MRARTSRQPLPIAGWREWVELPELGLGKLKAKLDTGARSSSLHAIDVHIVVEEGIEIVRFKVHPKQRTSKVTVAAEARLITRRRVRSSSGHVARRPVIRTPIAFMGRTWPIEITLADRAEMGFRMLLGREALRGRLLVDSGRSYYGGSPQKRRKRK